MRPREAGWGWGWCGLATGRLSWPAPLASRGTCPRPAVRGLAWRGSALAARGQACRGRPCGGGNSWQCDHYLGAIVRYTCSADPPVSRAVGGRPVRFTRFGVASVSKVDVSGEDSLGGTPRIHMCAEVLQLALGVRHLRLEHRDLKLQLRDPVLKTARSLRGGRQGMLEA